eukprot:TRINITY_DN1091_c0_g2_i6.p2 TRINITY_DN1091_c0_g2~~TRINITY_DN1091_c0_g2_i6.p2  ORF type:complete len:100 (+),score=7.16 TRINITY_DN1091_c0_g2_i6:203-502(+)
MAQIRKQVKASPITKRMTIGRTTIKTVVMCPVTHSMSLTRQPSIFGSCLVAFKHKVVLSGALKPQQWNSCKKYCRTSRVDSAQTKNIAKKQKKGKKKIT